MNFHGRPLGLFLLTTGLRILLGHKGSISIKSFRCNQNKKSHPFIRMMSSAHPRGIYIVKVSFYYYPAGIMLSFSLTYVFYEVKNCRFFLALMAMLILLRVTLPASIHVPALVLKRLWAVGRQFVFFVRKKAGLRGNAHVGVVSLSRILA